MKKDKAPKIFNSKKIILTLSIILGIAAIIFMYKVLDIKEVIRSFQNVTLELIIYYILIQLAMMLILTWRWKMILKSQGITHVSMYKLNKYRLVGQGVSFLTPSGKLGGEPIRAGLVSSRENIEFDKALSSVVIDRVIDITAAMLFFVIGLILVIFFFVMSKLLVEIVLVASLIVLGLLAIFNYRMLKGKKVLHHVYKFFRLHKFKKLKNFEKKLEDVETLIIKFYHQDTKYFYYAMGISLAAWGIMLLEYKIAALIVGQNLTAMQSFLIFSFVGAAYIVPVPMALGSLEASQISAFSIIGISTAAGLALSFLVRLKDLIIAIIGIIILGLYGLNIRKTIKDTDYLDDEVEKLEKTANSKKVKSKNILTKQNTKNQKKIILKK
ncbi:MAG: lysylphosphatidylglycerol synthase transmembrane domain-containing protein [Candidatus Woesearchaeota archaeon]|jgi:hypothetical protein